jgi:hypothetical protein
MNLIRTLVLAAVATVAVSSFADAKECSRPARPSVPDGKTASDDTMKAFQSKTLPAYAQSMSAYLHCVGEEMQSGKGEYDSVAEQWKTATKEFAATPAK